MQEKVLITGSTGFIGRNLLPVLKDHGYSLRILVRNERGKSFARKYTKDIKIVNYLEPRTLEGIGEGVDYVIHIAGVIKGRRFETFKKGNVYPTKNLLKAIKGYEVKKFIYISSQSAAGPSKQPIDESVPCQPVSFYGISKKYAERYVRASGIDYVILRPSVVFGEGDRETFLFFKSATKFGVITGIGSGPSFNLIYVKDLVRIILKLLEMPIKNKTYFVNNGEVWNGQRLAQLFSKILEKKVYYLSVPKFVVKCVAALNHYLGFNSMLTLEKYRELKESHWLCSNRRLKEEVFSEFTDTYKAFSDTLKWYRANHWL